MPVKRVLIGTPAYGGFVTSRYVTSLMETLAAFGAIGVAADVPFINNESLVPRARNTLCADFMNGGYDAFFQIDADIQWEAKDAVAVLGAVILHGLEVAAAPYPLKRLDWEAARRAALEGADAAAVARSAVSAFAWQPHDVPERRRFGPREFIRAKSASTGFLCTSYLAIKRLAETYPELRYSRSYSGSTDGPGYALFDTSIDSSGGYCPEDWTFCERWRKIGGEIWMLLGARLKHLGNYAFDGDFDSVVERS